MERLGMCQLVHLTLQRLEQLVLAVNDLMESRIDANLKIVANVLLVNLPEAPDSVWICEALGEPAWLFIIAKQQSIYEGQSRDTTRYPQCLLIMGFTNLRIYEPTDLVYTRKF